jgi:hypothetical protein
MNIINIECYQEIIVHDKSNNFTVQQFFVSSNSSHAWEKFARKFSSFKNYLVMLLGRPSVISRFMMMQFYFFV